MITRSLAQEVLRAALTTGGDFAELYMEDDLSSTLSWMDGRVENAVSARTAGAGVRVMRGTGAAYAYTNDCTRQGLLRCADQAAQALSGIAGGGAESDRSARDVTLTGSVAANAHPAIILPFYVPGEDKTALLLRACNAAKAVSPSINQVVVRAMDGDKRVLIANSEGVFVEDRRVRCRLAVNAVASNANETQSGSRSPGALQGYEFFKELDIEAVAKAAAETAVLMLGAPYCPAGVMPVAIESGFGGVIFHEACGHSLEAASVSKGASEFCGKLGKQVADRRVSAVDDGTMAGEWGSINVDDEGFMPQRNLLIKDGILMGYMVDRLGGRRMDTPPTGSSRRESYKYAATSRMTNTYICPGNDNDKEILSSMAEGLYCTQMGGGSVNPVSGEFNFAVQEAYLIKNGEIDRPVRGATLIGKGADVLMHIDRVGRDMRFGQGMCGASSGSVPTNVGQPLIRVSRMTVGGRKEG